MSLLFDFAVSPSGRSKLLRGGCIFYNDIWQEAVIQIHSPHGVFDISGLCRPSEAVITDEGLSAIADWLSPEAMQGSLFFFNGTGQVTTRHDFDVNLGRLALDDQHDLLFLTTAHSDKTRAKLFCYELATGKLLWSRWSPQAAAEVIVTSAEGCILIGHPARGCGGIRYLHKRTIRGRLLDRRVNSPYQAITFGEFNWDLGRADAARECLKFAAESEIAPSFRAKARRKLGEIAESQGDLTLALTQYLQASSLYPKIGVRRKIKALQQTIREKENRQ